MAKEPEDFCKIAKSTAAQASAQVTDFWNQHGNQITATVASVGTGVGVFVGCAALTAGAGSVLCAGLAGAAAGAVYSGMTCPEDANTARCVAIGVIAGAAAGLPGGAMMSAGMGMALAGAGGSMVGDGLDQLLTVGTIDPGRLAFATAAGAVLGAGTGAVFRGGRPNRPVANSAAEAEGAAAGIVYRRTDIGGGKPYIGKTKSKARFIARQSEHARANPDADFEFEIIGRANPGIDLDRLEEFHIRQGGGPTNLKNPEGRMANLLHQMSDSRYQDAGGDFSP